MRRGYVIAKVIRAFKVTSLQLRSPQLMNNLKIIARSFVNTGPGFFIFGGKKIDALFSFHF